MAIRIYDVEISELELLCAEGIKAGFPSPAADFIDAGIDLNKYLVKHPASTFYGRVDGDSLQGIGIADGDLMIIDKSVKPKEGHVVVCFIDGEFTAKIIRFEKDCGYLVPANDKYDPIQVTKDSDFQIWGVVTSVVKDCTKGFQDVRAGGL